ncbi:MAG: hypothetical protein JWL92_484 [Candidatus Nomurabacteria bacterium]|nr:hypothetical protein [Candidatus Nomurabacteria bacterium]
MRINIYIDGNNLYQSAKGLGFEIDYKKFSGWLRQKHRPSSIFLFIGFLPERVKFYQYLKECGFTLVFKETISVSGTIKGNCDAELVLKAVSDFYTKSFDSVVLISGDGDFGCLVEFLQLNNALEQVWAPDKNKCSVLLKNKTVNVAFLNRQYPKFSK